jgi:dienelactone hydrolase
MILAFRGTDFARVDDLVNDAVIVFGKSQYLPRTRDGIEIARYLKALLTREGRGMTLTITGHSLGAKIGLNVATAEHLTAYLYNIGSSPTDKPSDLLFSGICKLTNIKKCQALDYIVHFHVMGDPISASAANLVPWHVERQSPSAGKNPHTIDNFL